MENRKGIKLISFVFAFVVVAFVLVLQEGQRGSIRRLSSESDNSSNKNGSKGQHGVSKYRDPNTRMVKKKNLKPDPSNMTYNLPESAADWCMEPYLDPLPYDECEDRKTLNVIPLHGGLTNALKNVLLGAIVSFEEDRCFVIDESENEMIKRNDAEEQMDSLMQRYFEPIGLPESDPLVKKAAKKRNFEFRSHKNVWDSKENNYSRRRPFGRKFSIDSLGYHKVEGHQLKREMLKRMWRPVSVVRDATCSRLATFGLREEFIALSFRRGDKAKEKVNFPEPFQYIRAIKHAVQSHFDGNIPKIFVATDDCAVMAELRQLRPHWVFLSECDLVDHEENSGFDLKAMADWTMEDTDAHYQKFFVELYAMAIAKYFIGVSYTNVSWWVYFMRGQHSSSFKILETPGTEKQESIDMW